jgi:hypothetical protein
VTETFSVSVSRETQRKLKKAANRAYGGNGKKETARDDVSNRA